MTGLEWVALASMLINSWQFYDRGGLEEENQIYEAMAKQCQESKGNNRITELRAANERQHTEAAIQRITVRSKLDIGKSLQMGSGNCDSVAYPGGGRIVEEINRRTKATNNEWLRSPGSSDDGQADP